MIWVLMIMDNDGADGDCRRIVSVHKTEEGAAAAEKFIAHQHSWIDGPYVLMD
jgi:hypothetical protein